MPLSTHYEEELETLFIVVTGHFNADMIPAFTQAYRPPKNVSPKIFVVDLLHLEHLESAGIGMLLVLKEFADSIDAQVKIKVVDKPILNLFETTQLNQIFDVDALITS